MSHHATVAPMAKPHSKRRSANRIVTPGGHPAPEPPKPQIIGVRTAKGEKLTFRAGALAACKEGGKTDEGKPTTHVCIGGQWTEIVAAHEAVVGLMTGNFQPRSEEPDGKG